MQKHATLAISFAVAFGPGAFAQDVTADLSGATVLEPIIVTTPLRRASSLESSTSSIVVIGQAELERTAAPDLPSLLKSVPGVAITSYGGQGSGASVSLRGMGPAQSLVLVNGVRTASATTGTSALFNIPLASIERVEIVKGPHSAQYGADAIAGVINIITKTGASSCANGASACTTVSAGVSYPWGGQLSANRSGRTDDGLVYSFGGSILGTQGYDFTLPSAWGHEPDDDGFLLGNLNFSVARELDWGSLYAEGLYGRGSSQQDADYPYADRVDTNTFAGKAGIRIDHTDDWFSTIEFTNSLDYSKNYRDGVAGSERFDTLRYGVLATTQKAFMTGAVGHILTGGVEAYREEVKANSIDFAVTERDLAAVFGQYALEYDALTINSGIRLDHNEQFGNATTYNIGASYEVVPDLTLRAMYGTGFRAPTFNDLYYPGFSNPDLEPERSRSYEIGALWQAGADTTLDVAFYQSWLKDALAIVDPDNDPFTWNSEIRNVARARITGIEASVAHQFDERWSGRASIDLRQPKDEVTGKDIPNRERFKTSAELSFQATEQLGLSARVLYVASRYADEDNTEKLPAYKTVDFTAIYGLDEMSQVKFSVENVFDEDYSTVAGYRAPGRTLNLNFTRTF